jgi:hypothetical protein
MSDKTKALAKPYNRDNRGRFEQGTRGGPRAGAGRPPGAKNKTTLALREAILGALEAAGGDEGSVGYLRRLAVENSSAFAGLLSRILPSTLAAASDSDGGIVKLSFERVIVYPDGRREIDGVTPKALSSPDVSPMLPSSTDPTDKDAT